VRLRLLGSAAGGGFPQWNCGCANCAGLRNGAVAARARSQTSAALSADGERWFLLHASPDVRAQIESLAPLAPRAPRGSPIAGVLLANADLDACLGLLSLREGTPLVVVATRRVLADLRACSFARALERSTGPVEWRALELGESAPLDDEGHVRVTALPVPGKPPFYAARAASPEDNVALVLKEARSATSVVWAPTVARRDAALERALRETDLALFDGTLFRDDELARQGLGPRTARQMAHWPVGESLPWLARLARRRVLVHVNNSNPILREDSPERRQVEQVGVEVGHDGMDLL
jgi:pyrroloquinoline quinone biosynthesis protein B